MSAAARAALALPGSLRRDGDDGDAGAVGAARPVGSDGGRPAAVTLTGDGTFSAPAAAAAPGERAELPEDPQLAALTRLRALLGDDLEEQIATRLYLPAGLGTDATDHVLPGTLALLTGTSGDLAPYGWRIGTGLGRAWRRAVEQRERLLDAARIAWFGYEGPVMSTVLGPATLAGATYLGTGERTLSDPGAVRDLPMLLAEGLVEHLSALRERVPGARPMLFVREDAVAGVVGGRIPTPSGRRTYPPVRAEEVGTLWRCLIGGLAADAGLGAQDITVGVGVDPELIRQAQEAGARRLAISPRRMPGLGSEAGRTLWETVAQAHEDGSRLELVVDPRPGGRMEEELDGVLDIWHRLGYSEREAAGFTLIAHTGASHAVHAGRVDPSSQPAAEDLLDEPTLEALLRRAPAWAERVAG
ncbi:hypothetical protein ACXET9_06725 [Brachybacterium sp. DNPG3]